MNCDRIAPWYRWLEYGGFGRALEQRRFAFLPFVRGSRQVLLLGEGDGRFLERFVAAAPEAVVDYADASGRMLQLAAERVGSLDRVRFHQLDVRSGELPGAEGGYDLIVTHFFLDCFSQEEAETVIARLAVVASARARWLISEFHQPARGWRRWRAVVWVRSLYLLFRFATGLRTTRLPRYEAALEQYGFRRVRQEYASGALLVSELWERVFSAAEADVTLPVPRRNR